MLSQQPAAHEVPARDVSLTIRRNGPYVADPLNMTSGTSFDYPHTAERLGSTQGDERSPSVKYPLRRRSFDVAPHAGYTASNQRSCRTTVSRLS